MSGYFELKTTKAGKPMFNLKAGNHEIILTSQPYNSMDAAKAGIESVRKNGPNEAMFERKESGKGEPYFVLKASNGQIIGQSEMYTSTAGRDNGIASVMRNAVSEKVVEVKAES